jgi:hypothetical protein
MEVMVQVVVQVQLAVLEVLVHQMLFQVVQQQD